MTPPAAWPGAMAAAIADAREEVCRLHAALAASGLVAWTSGNVSARVPGSDANRASGAGSASTDSGDGVAIPLVIGIGVLAAMGGFAAAFVLRRKSTPS